MLLDQARMREVYDRCRRADMTIASVGGLGRHNRIHSLGLLTAAEQRSLASAGAVGDYLCHFLDRDGALVKHPVNGRVVGVSPRDLTEVPIRILASGGAEKTTILRATLAAGYATVLITDEKTARLLVAANAVSRRPSSFPLAPILFPSRPPLLLSPSPPEGGRGPG